MWEVGRGMLEGFNPRREASPFQTTQSMSKSPTPYKFQSQTGSLALSDGEHRLRAGEGTAVSIPDGKPRPFRHHPLPVVLYCRAMFQSQTGSLALSDHYARLVAKP